MKIKSEWKWKPMPRRAYVPFYGTNTTISGKGKLRDVHHPRTIPRRPVLPRLVARRNGASLGGFGGNDQELRDRRLLAEHLDPRGAYRDLRDSRARIHRRRRETKGCLHQLRISSRYRDPS